MRTPSEAVAGLLAQPPMPAIVAAARRHRSPVVVVGGALRDALLGRPPADIDIAVGADLGAFIEVFTQCCGRRPVSIGDEWRDTHRTTCAGVQVDVANLLGDLPGDLSKRDFTINAMAVQLNAARQDAGTEVDTGSVDGADRAPGTEVGAPQDFELIDAHGGLRDLEAGVLRMVSEGAFDDDPLRMLRAARYVATLPGVEIEAATQAAMRARAGSIGAVAAERVQTEWAHLLNGDDWATGVHVATAAGLVATLVDEIDLGIVEAWKAFEASDRDLEGDNAPLVARLASVVSAVAAENPDETCRRLLERRWPASPARAAVRTASWAARLSEASVDELAGFAVDDRDSARRAVDLATARALRDERSGSPNPGLLADYARRAAAEPWVSGADLLEWGMDEGPELGDLLSQVRSGQVQRRWGSAHEARSWARRQVRKSAASGRIANG